MPVIERTTRGPAETARFAAELASKLETRPHTVVLLMGDIGAGKTTFVRGFVAHFGSTDLVTSPTFTLMNEYRAEGVRICHFDLYRLGSAAEAGELGIEDELQTADFSLVEWPSVGGDLFDFSTVVVKISYGDSEDERIIRIEGEWDERS